MQGKLRFNGDFEAFRRTLAPLNLGSHWEDKPNGVRMLRCPDGANLHWSSTKGTVWCDGTPEAREALFQRVEPCIHAASRAKVSSDRLPDSKATHDNAPSVLLRRMEALEDENARLKQLLAEAMLELASLRDAKKYG